MTIHVTFMLIIVLLGFIDAKGIMFHKHIFVPLEWNLEAYSFCLVCQLVAKKNPFKLGNSF